MQAQPQRTRVTIRLPAPLQTGKVLNPAASKDSVDIPRNAPAPSAVPPPPVAASAPSLPAPPAPQCVRVSIAIQPPKTEAPLLGRMQRISRGIAYTAAAANTTLLLRTLWHTFTVLVPLARTLQPQVSAAMPLWEGLRENSSEVLASLNRTIPELTAIRDELLRIAGELKTTDLSLSLKDADLQSIKDELLAALHAGNLRKIQTLIGKIPAFNDESLTLRENISSLFSAVQNVTSIIETITTETKVPLENTLASVERFEELFNTTRPLVPHIQDAFEAMEDRSKYVLMLGVIIAVSCLIDLSIQSARDIRSTNFRWTPSSTARALLPVAYIASLFVTYFSIQRAAYESSPSDFTSHTRHTSSIEFARMLLPFMGLGFWKIISFIHAYTNSRPCERRAPTASASASGPRVEVVSEEPQAV